MYGVTLVLYLRFIGYWNKYDTTVTIQYIDSPASKDKGSHLVLHFICKDVVQQSLSEGKLETLTQLQSFKLKLVKFAKKISINQLKRRCESFETYRYIM